VPNDPELRRRITSQHHDTRVAGHPGRWKTLELISRNYCGHRCPLHWPICENMRPLSPTKIQRRRPTGELHPAPTRRTAGCHQCGFHCGTSRLTWVHAVMNVVDSVGKRAHFIPTNTTITHSERPDCFYTMSGSARTPTPRRLRSGSQFVGGVHPRAVQAARYHTVNDHGLSPTGGRTDGTCQPRAGAVSPSLCERAGKMTGMSYFPTAEFQYNNHIHSSTQQTPFLLDTGQHLRMDLNRRSHRLIWKQSRVTDRMHSALTEASPH